MAPKNMAETGMENPMEAWLLSEMMTGAAKFDPQRRKA
jgi:hypothetical protein